MSCTWLLVVVFTLDYCCSLLLLSLLIFVSVLPMWPLLCSALSGGSHETGSLPNSSPKILKGEGNNIRRRGCIPAEALPWKKVFIIFSKTDLYIFSFVSILILCMATRNCKGLSAFRSLRNSLKNSKWCVFRRTSVKFLENKKASLVKRKGWWP